MQVHRNGAVVMPKNQKSRNGSVTITTPDGRVWNEALRLANGDVYRLLVIDSYHVLVCNSREHRNSIQRWRKRAPKGKKA